MRVRRLLVAVVLPGALIAGPLAGSASAHVEAEASGAAQGGSGTVTFSAEAEGTTPLEKLEVVLPTDTPLTDVTVPAKDGWTSTVSNADSASGGATPGRITWTATGAGIEPEKTGEFPIRVGRFPTVAEVVFKALVTYADGTVVSWIELQAPGGPEPEHPAPILELAPAAPATTAAAATVAITTAAAAAPSAAATGPGGGGSAGGISPPVAVAFVVAVLLVIGVVVAARRRGRTR